MVLVNAMYFKGTWCDPFDADEIIEKKFHLINEELVSVPFMTSDERFGYGSFEGYKMMKLPYKFDLKRAEKSFFEVDERGTKAAACSVVCGRPMACARKNYKPPPPPPSFVADHPFMFMIREDAAQAVLFG
ncbi:hypothetical protein CTI12_AA536220 [Artemisia annua]|uniref:Serpin domain-containing protein n=1 Tax=Artemisia annua TaxID=35608 RepID=A0A2U1L2Z8_ARTAN|nr:hypothetical protein CTI12_AA536220 [Artemisia annua]